MRILPIILVVIVVAVVATIYFSILVHPVTPTTTPTTHSPTISSTPAPSLGGKLSSIREVRRIIRTEVIDTTVLYREEDFFSEKDFSKIMKYWDMFKSIVVKRFRDRVSGYRVSIGNVSVYIVQENKSIILTCYVYGAISKTGNRYYATFEWLIRPFGLDFIDNHFKESMNGLYWEGEINGVYTIIDERFPNVGEIYKAWGDPVGHCHAHVWWVKE